MRQLIKTHLAPNWIVAIFFLSLAEAIGLAIHFNADLIDPELASIEPLSMSAQGAAALLHARRDCELNNSGAHMRYDDCPPLR